MTCSLRSACLRWGHRSLLQGSSEAVASCARVVALVTVSLSYTEMYARVVALVTVSLSYTEMYYVSPMLVAPVSDNACLFDPFVLFVSLCVCAFVCLLVCLCGFSCVSLVFDCLCWSLVSAIRYSFVVCFVRLVRLISHIEPPEIYDSHGKRAIGLNLCFACCFVFNIWMRNPN